MTTRVGKGPNHTGHPTVDEEGVFDIEKVITTDSNTRAVEEVMGGITIREDLKYELEEIVINQKRNAERTKGALSAARGDNEPHTHAEINRVIVSSFREETRTNYKKFVSVREEKMIKDGEVEHGFNGLLSKQVRSDNFSFSSTNTSNIPTKVRESGDFSGRIIGDARDSNGGGGKVPGSMSSLIEKGFIKGGRVMPEIRPEEVEGGVINREITNSF